MFYDVNERYVYKRVKVLKDQGFIDSLAVCWGDRSRRAYHITPIALKIVGDEFPFEIDRPVLKSDSPFHDMDLLDVIERFNKLKIVNEIIHENVLRSCSELENLEETREFVWLRSDALVYLRGPSFSANIALEYDRADKATSRYRDKFESYYRKKKIHAVLFISKRSESMNRLKQIDAEACQGSKSKIYFCRLSDVISETESLTFTNHRGGAVNLT